MQKAFPADFDKVKSCAIFELTQKEHEDQETIFDLQARIAEGLAGMGYRVTKVGPTSAPGFAAFSCRVNKSFDVDVLLCSGRTPGKYSLDTTPWRPLFSRVFRLNWTDDSRCAEEWQRLLSAIEDQIVDG